MRVPSLTLVAASAVLLASTKPPPAVTPLGPSEEPAARQDGDVRAADPLGPSEEPAARQDGDVRAADLLAKVRDCTPVSRGRYRSDAGAPAAVPVCGLHGAVFWKADMDIDCDGRPTARCNRRTDPQFYPASTYQQSDGGHLNAERLPYIVVPAASRVWNPRAHGVGGGSVAAVVYRDRVQYAVVGDTGPRDLIGEASYATARRLGIPADPRRGGARSGVTYIVFKNARVSAIEDHAAAVAAGERLARQLVSGGTARGR
ncbi:glycoside hydrolase family 75 protein [Streptomyces sp. NPDC005202]|uniref:glycoside hydrolase family 75 protein n=1 Tax=Streptomyces sp. NPDC005202 TaxID=3157021 RepID=UPI0033A46B4B